MSWWSNRARGITVGRALQIRQGIASDELREVVAIVDRVHLELVDGRRVLIGSQRADEFAAAICSFVGDRGDGSKEDAG